MELQFRSGFLKMVDAKSEKSKNRLEISGKTDGDSDGRSS
jgi:hypothetical protein